MWQQAAGSWQQQVFIRILYILLETIWLDTTPNVRMNKENLSKHLNINHSIQNWTELRVWAQRICDRIFNYFHKTRKKLTDRLFCIPFICALIQSTWELFNDSVCLHPFSYSMVFIVCTEMCATKRMNVR